MRYNDRNTIAVLAAWFNQAEITEGTAKSYRTILSPLIHWISESHHLEWSDTRGGNEAALERERTAWAAIKSGVRPAKPDSIASVLCFYGHSTLTRFLTGISGQDEIDPVKLCSVLRSLYQFLHAAGLSSITEIIGPSALSRRRRVLPVLRLWLQSLKGSGEYSEQVVANYRNNLLAFVDSWRREHALSAADENRALAMLRQQDLQGLQESFTAAACTDAVFALEFIAEVSGVERTERMSVLRNFYRWVDAQGLGTVTANDIGDPDDPRYSTIIGWWLSEASGSRGVAMSIAREVRRMLEYLCDRYQLPYNISRELKVLRRLRQGGTLVEFIDGGAAALLCRHGKTSIELYLASRERALTKAALINARCWLNRFFDWERLPHLLGTARIESQGAEAEPATPPSEVEGTERSEAVCENGEPEAATQAAQPPIPPPAQPEGEAQPPQDSPTEAGSAPAEEAEAMPEPPPKTEPAVDEQKPEACEQQEAAAEAILPPGPSSAPAEKKAPRPHKAGKEKKPETTGGFQLSSPVAELIKAKLVPSCLYAEGKLEFGRRVPRDIQMLIRHSINTIEFLLAESSMTIEEVLGVTDRSADAAVALVNSASRARAQSMLKTQVEALRAAGLGSVLESFGHRRLFVDLEGEPLGEVEVN